MSLLILANDFPPRTGGIQRYLYGLAEALVRQELEVTVIAVDHPEADRFDAESRVSTLRVPAETKLQVARNLAEVAARHIGADPSSSPVSVVVAGNWWPDGYAAWLLKRRIGVPYVVMGYGREMIQTGLNVVKLLMQHLIIRSASGGLATSRYTARRLRQRGLAAERIAVIYGGVDPEQFVVAPEPAAQLRRHLAPDDAPVILTVGRLVRRKGHSQVLTALPEIASAVGPVKYAVAGTGPEQQRLQQLAQQHSVSEYVQFIGHVDDTQLGALYQAADVFVMPSRDLYGRPIEGLGLVYLEANLCGLPVVAGASGGAADAVVDGKTGLLVNPEKPSEIASAIIRLLSDPRLAAQMGWAGRQRVLNEFTWDEVARRLREALADWGLLEVT